MTGSTYLVGNILGKLGTLKQDLDGMRRYHAWQRRDVNKHMMSYLTANGTANTVDQYEFALASLIDLGKISSEDLGPIMAKFRKLSKQSGTDSGYIHIDDVPEETNVDEVRGDDEKLEQQEGVDGT